MGKGVEDMISNQILQNTLDGLKAISRVDFSVIDTDGKTYFRIAVKDGYVNLLSIQIAGKKRMSVGDFLRGYRHMENSKVE